MTNPVSGLLTTTLTRPGLTFLYKKILIFNFGYVFEYFYRWEVVKRRIVIPLKHWSWRNQIIRESSGREIRRERINRTGSVCGSRKNRRRWRRRSGCRIVLFFETDLFEFGNTRSSSWDFSSSIIIMFLFLGTQTRVIIFSVSIASTACFTAHFLLFSLSLSRYYSERWLRMVYIYKKRKRRKLLFVAKGERNKKQ